MYGSVGGRAMTGQKRRTQILLEPEQHEALAEIASREGRSISEIVREIVGRHLRERARDAKRRRAVDALERLTGLREKIEQRSGVYQGDLIAEARAERYEQVVETIKQFPAEQQEMLIDLIRSWRTETRRREIAHDAQESLAAYRNGQLETQSAQAVSTELLQSLDDQE